jgi:hypothetical protein
VRIHGSWPGEVQRPARFREDLLRIAQVCVHVLADAAGLAGQQGAGVRQHERVVVHVDDLGFGGDRLGHGVGGVGGRQAGADVEELAYPAPAGQVADGAGEKRPVRPRAGDHLGTVRGDLLGGLAVGRVVIF